VHGLHGGKAAAAGPRALRRPARLKDHVREEDDDVELAVGEQVQVATDFGRCHADLVLSEVEYTHSDWV
jgi:hypothetical protein